MKVLGLVLYPWLRFYMNNCKSGELRTLNTQLTLFLFQESGGAHLEDEVHPRRLKFGFAPELEQIVRDKVESSTNLYVVQ